MLCWKEPLRIISSNSWPCSGCPENHRKCFLSHSCVFVADVRNSSHCLGIIEPALLLGFEWPGLSGRHGNRNKAKTFWHIINAPCNNPSGILTVKPFTKLYQCCFILVFRRNFLSDCSVAPLLKCLSVCLVRQASCCENSVFHRLCFGKRYWPSYMTQIALQAGGKKGGIWYPSSQIY